MVGGGWRRGVLLVAGFEEAAVRGSGDGERHLGGVATCLLPGVRRADGGDGTGWGTRYSRRVPAACGAWEILKLSGSPQPRGRRWRAGTRAGQRGCTCGRAVPQDGANERERSSLTCRHGRPLRLPPPSVHTPLPHRLHQHPRPVTMAPPGTYHRLGRIRDLAQHAAAQPPWPEKLTFSAYRPFSDAKHPPRAVGREGLLPQMHRAQTPAEPSRVRQR